MRLDALVIDVLRPTGALHTIVVRPRADADAVIVADVGSQRVLNAEGTDVSVSQSRPRRFEQEASSSVYDLQIRHEAIWAQRGVYYLGFPPEWSVCSVTVAHAPAGGSPPAWTGMHSHADDSSWIECPFGSASASCESLAIRASIDSDPAHGLSPLPEFRALHHRHSPVEVVRAAARGPELAIEPGAFGVKIDLRAVLKSLSRTGA